VLAGGWSSSDSAPTPIPREPHLNVLVSFALPNAYGVLDAERKRLTGKPHPADKNALIYITELPLHSLWGTATIALIDIKGDVTEIPIQLSLVPGHPLLEVDPDCAAHGLSATVAAVRPIGTISFLRCARAGSSLLLKLWSWDGLQWTNPPAGWRAATAAAAGPVKPGQRGTAPPVLTAHLSLFPEGGRPAIYEIGLADASRQPATMVTITHKEERRVGWSASAGLGPTLSSYFETASGLSPVKVSQISLTAKLQAQFKVLPPRIDLAFSIFGTLFPLGVSPSSLPSARWLGINARAGYQLPLDAGWKNVVTFLPGFYEWTMYVAGDAYGVSKLNGPQLVIAYSREVGSRLFGFGTFQRFGAYGKFAAMSAGFALTGVDNRELAVGANAVVRFFKIPQPLVFSVDVSSLQFAQGVFAMSLQTYSFSIGYSFL
jgi:hypothetical protein